MTTEQLLNQWQTLDPDEQAKVLAFIDSLLQRKNQFNLGEKLREIRQEIIASGIPLLTSEEVEKEKAARRGGYRENSQ
ncbi:hypothetical protein Xen7305DRAFT_00052470 [Xenococcus sp. PCC 7305]|uniref:hypothetical protein n=1 Tax=Xenococcus sp. PCC 7305 TaxID=102125 RepID=UPI0002ABAF1B|nr:hypothetical protein [Xenococcus sp. PCC 7305]ELS05501.1 hypothetical protein Xen7305DRAFT_00052470 [Xenococcus sp. PCC 7305]